MGNGEPRRAASSHGAGLGPAAISMTRSVLALVVLTLAGAGVAIEHGFDEPPVALGLVHLGQGLLVGVYALQRMLGGYAGAEAGRSGATPRFEWGLGGLVVAGLIGHAVAGGMGAAGPVASLGWRVVEVAIGLLWLAQLWRVNALLSHRLARPGVLFPLSFVGLIALGTALLLLPRATPAGRELSLLDALFTMTSAVCVTGLTVRDTASGFTPFGQLLIAVFIQLGALGILIFGSTLAMLLGQSLSLRENVTLSRMLQDQPLHRLSRFAVFIVATTLGIELVGAAVLFPLWQSAGEPLTAMQRLGLSAFHSISAFCNAGFDITGNSLVDYRYRFLSHAVIAPLIVLGGLGFPVLENAYRVARDCARRLLARRSRRSRPDGAARPGMASRLTLHSKLVLTTTAGVYLLGVVTLAGSQLMPFFYQQLDLGQTAHVERPGGLDGEALGKLVADSGFMAVTARTAGFHTVPMDELGPAAEVSLMGQMMIGGSPGSTAGGVKTTVLALVVLSVIGTMRPGKETEAFGRSISDQLVRQAVTLAVCFVTLIVMSTFLISLVENASLRRIVFEVISAASTTGLSSGLSASPALEDFSQSVLIGTMFLGRVGPLTLLGMVLVRNRPRRSYRYPHERVSLG